MIKGVNLRYFKAFEEANIEIKPITIILGPNNSGKSSILSSIRILSQTIDSYDNEVPLLLNGSLGDFGTYGDIVNENEKKRHVGISLNYSLDEESRHIPKEISDQEIDLKLRFNYRTRRKEIVLNNSEVYIGGDKMIETKYSKGSERQLVEEVVGNKVPDQLKSSASDELKKFNFIPRFSLFGVEEKEDSALGKFITDNIRAGSIELNRAGMYIRRQLERMEYVGAMRAAPSRTYLFTGERRQRVGPRGENAVNILAMDDRRGGSKSKNISKQVGDWLRKAKMGDKITIEPISDRHYELRIKHPETGEVQNFADTGYGHSQVLPVLVAGKNLPERGTLMVEQPEIHLHPKAQAELGDFFVSLYNENKYSIIETHSEHMIIRIQRYIARGELDPDDVVFHYVYPGESKKLIEKMEIDGRATFKNDWPHGFFPERLEESRKLAIERD